MIFCYEIIKYHILLFVLKLLDPSFDEMANQRDYSITAIPNELI